MRADDLMVEMLRESARRAAANGLDLASGGTMLGCPAMWDAPQRKRLHELARRAGLEVTLADLVDEPVAAGIAWLSEREASAKPERVVVFDMGGGTLDIAVLEVQGTDVSVLAALGVGEAGNALDKSVAEDLEYALASKGTDIRLLEKPKRARLRLQHAAPDVKVSLSSVAELDVKLPRREFGIASIPYGRVQLNEVFASQMDRAEVYVATALRIALLPTATDADSAHDIARAPLEELTDQVDVVVLSGGMSQIPYVTERLRRMFGDGTRIETACAKPEAGGRHRARQGLGLRFDQQVPARLRHPARVGRGPPAADRLRGVHAAAGDAPDRAGAGGSALHLHRPAAGPARERHRAAAGGLPLRPGGQGHAQRLQFGRFHGGAQRRGLRVLHLSRTGASSSATPKASTRAASTGGTVPRRRPCRHNASRLSAPGASRRGRPRAWTNLACCLVSWGRSAATRRLATIHGAVTVRSARISTVTATSIVA